MLAVEDLPEATKEDADTICKCPQARASDKHPCLTCFLEYMKHLRRAVWLTLL